MPIRLAIVNDYEVVVVGLAEMLAPYEDEIQIVELDAQVEPAHPVDIALYDTFAQAQGDGPHVARLVRNPLVRRVVIYSWNSDPRLITNTLALGVAGYLSKTLNAKELVEALRAVHAGEKHVSVDFELGGTEPGDWPGRHTGLTRREAEVIALITQGLSNAQIADRASLSINSVKTYIRQSYQKMGVATRAQAVLWGVQNGFMPDRTRFEIDTTAGAR